MVIEMLVSLIGIQLFGSPPPLISNFAGNLINLLQSFEFFVQACNLSWLWIFFTGQKSSKQRDSDSEPSPSPRKSPKRTEHSKSPRAPHRSESASVIEQRTSHGDQSDLPKSKSLTLSSPSPKPAADIEEKENFPQTQAEAHISGSPIRVNGGEEPLTPKRINGELRPQATSTPAANGVLYTEQLSK